MAIDLEAMRAKLEQSKNGGKKNQTTQKMATSTRRPNY